MRRILPAIAFALPTLYITILAVAGTYEYVGKPFPGFLLYSNHVISPLQLPSWLPPQDNVGYPWILKSLDEVPLRDPKDTLALMGSFHPGSMHRFSFRKGSATMEKVIPIVTFTMSDFLGICLPMSGTGILITLIGVATFSAVPMTPASVFLYCLCLFLGGWLGIFCDYMVSWHYPLPFLFAVAMAPVSVLGLAVSFPSVPDILKRHFWGVPLIVLVLGFAVFGLFSSSLGNPDRYIIVDTVNTGVTMTGFMSLCARLVRMVSFATRDADRQAAKIAIAGGLVPFGLIMTPFAAFLYMFHIPYGLFIYTIPMTILPMAAIAWAIYKAGHGDGVAVAESP